MSVICANSDCRVNEVGPFMAGISQACGNVGNCQLTDIMTVFANVGNWTLGIVGALVFLMYIYGGVMLMLGGAGDEYIKKGKQALRISTVGLLIVFFAFAGIKTLEYALSGGELGKEEFPDQYVSCGPGNVNVDKACGFNMVCSNVGTCITRCESRFSGDVGSGKWACIDRDFNPDITNCQVDLCPGDETVQCCEVVKENSDLEDILKLESQ